MHLYKISEQQNLFGLCHVQVILFSNYGLLIRKNNNVSLWLVLWSCVNMALCQWSRSWVMHNALKMLFIPNKQLVWYATFLVWQYYPEITGHWLIFCGAGYLIIFEEVYCSQNVIFFVANSRQTASTVCWACELFLCSHDSSSIGDSSV